MDDLISRAAVVDAIDGVDWYHQNQHGEMVHGANPDDHQAWYKAEDIYKAVESVPSAQQWISCKTALPKTEEKVLVTCEHLDIYGKPHRYVCKAFHVDRYTMRSDVDWWDEGCDEYREEDDQYYVLEGWYECIHNWDDYSCVRIAEDKVVAWCPLPEPWKGERDG